MKVCVLLYFFLLEFRQKVGDPRKGYAVPEFYCTVIDSGPIALNYID